MSFLSNIDFSSGTDWFGAATDAASSAASSSSGWFGGGLDFVTKGASGAFGWLERNPEAANLLGGVASGAGQYLAARETAKENAKLEEKMYERRRRDSMINPGELGDYGSYRSVGGKGLLTNGLLASVRDR